LQHKIAWAVPQGFLRPFGTAKPGGRSSSHGIVAEGLPVGADWLKLFRAAVAGPHPRRHHHKRQLHHIPSALFLLKASNRTKIDLSASHPEQIKACLPDLASPRKEFRAGEFSGR